MKTLTLLLSLVILASCSATYKTGQTPDDLYYSKAKPIKVEEKVHYDRTVYSYQESNIRMSISNARWRNLDYDYDYDYKYSPYAYGYNYGYYYNPYYYPCPVYTIASSTSANPKTTTIRKANLGGYSNTVTNYQPTKVNYGNTTTTRRVYNNTNYDNNTRYNPPVETSDNRTYTPTNTNSNSGSSSNNGGSSNSGGSTVVRPGRGG
jgi:hypothetical protein